MNAQKGMSKGKCGLYWSNFMRDLSDIRILLDELEHQSADALEGQDLDFKEWNTRSLRDAVALVVEMAICMANGGGGTVVFGVNDKAAGRSNVILGVPPEIDINRLKKAVYDSTDPKLTPVFQELSVPEGTGRLIVMQIYPGLPPYTDTQGRGKIRIGTDCQPLTGTLRRRVMVETGETDFTAIPVSGRPETLISAAAMERLREVARRENAPDDLLRRPDRDLLSTLGLIRDGCMLRAAMLLTGTENAIRKHFPDMSGRICACYLTRITPIAQMGTMHSLLPWNAYLTGSWPTTRLPPFPRACFTSRSGPIPKSPSARLCSMPSSMPITGFTGPSWSSNFATVSKSAIRAGFPAALRRTTSCTMSRMYQALLIEGREPPVIIDEGEAVRVIFRATDLSIPFRLFVAEEADKGRILTVEDLLLLQYLLRHSEIDTPTAARITQQSERGARETLSRMELDLGYVERGGTGRGTYWILRHDLHRRLSAPGHAERDRRIDWEAAKTRVLSVLKQRAERGEPGLSNAEIRQITHFDRAQVKRLMAELNREKAATVSGRGRGARWQYKEDSGNG